MLSQFDFEWAVKSGEVYWLQVRPITGIKPALKETILFINPGEKPGVKIGESHSWSELWALVFHKDERYRELIAGRKREYERQMKLLCPLHRIESHDLIKLYFAAPADQCTKFRGIGASVETVMGKARVILGLKDVDRLQPGEILFTLTTDPSWTPYFSIAGAIVVEIGSMLSYGAVVVREVGIPAVLGLSGIMGAVREGDTLIVNGSEGTVEIIH